jgi:hypothetical protein
MPISRKNLGDPCVLLRQFLFHIRKASWHALIESPFHFPEKPEKLMSKDLGLSEVIYVPPSMLINQLVDWIQTVRHGVLFCCSRPTKMEEVVFRSDASAFSKVGRQDYNSRLAPVPGIWYFSTAPVVSKRRTNVPFSKGVTLLQLMH